MEIRLIIVNPKYQLNIGYLARCAKNFGIKKLYFIKPRVNILGKKAIMYSKHAHELLENAIIYENFKEAIIDCDVVIGTSGIFRTNPKLGKTYTPEEAFKAIKKNYNSNSIIGLIIGREDKGLFEDELLLCDIQVHINTNPEYPVLNISHSVSILLYELMRSDFKKELFNKEKPEKHEIEKLFFVFDNSLNNKKVRDKKMVSIIFRKIIKKAQPEKHELHALISAFKNKNED